LKFEKIKHGFKTLAECGGIRGVDDTSSFLYAVKQIVDTFADFYEVIVYNMITDEFLHF
jgi:hypothetical protein